MKLTKFHQATNSEGISKSLSVLLIEKYQLVQHCLKRLLTKTVSCEVTICIDIIEAVDLIKKREAFDLVIISIDSSHSASTRFFRNIHDLRIHTSAYLPIVAITFKAPKVERYLLAVCDAVIDNPSEQVFLSTVNSYLSDRIRLLNS